MSLTPGVFHTTHFMELISRGFWGAEGCGGGKVGVQGPGASPRIWGHHFRDEFPTLESFSLSMETVLCSVCSSRCSWGFQGSGLVSIPLQSMGTSQPHSCPMLGCADLQEPEQGWHSQKIPTSTWPLLQPHPGFFSPGVFPTILGWLHPAMGAQPAANAPHPLISERENASSPPVGAEICMEHSESYRRSSTEASKRNLWS